MSVLEIILYALIGGATVIYVTVTIVKWIKGRKKTGEEDNEDSKNARDM